MGKAQQRERSKARSATGASGEEARKGKSGRKRAARPAVVPLDDAEIGPVAGIPDDGQIEEAMGALSPEDRRAFERARKLLAEHLGSHAAARLWLASPAPGLVTTPLEAIRQGQAKLILDMLESQWGPGPSYA